jgi:hypothetical protein
MQDISPSSLPKCQTAYKYHARGCLKSITTPHYLARVSLAPSGERKKRPTNQEHDEGGSNARGHGTRGGGDGPATVTLGSWRSACPRSTADPHQQRAAAPTCAHSRVASVSTCRTRHSPSTSKATSPATHSPPATLTSPTAWRAAMPCQKTKPTCPACACV